MLFINASNFANYIDIISQTLLFSRYLRAKTVSSKFLAWGKSSWAIYQLSFGRIFALWRFHESARATFIESHVFFRRRMSQFRLHWHFTRGDHIRLRRHASFGSLLVRICPCFCASHLWWKHKSKINHLRLLTLRQKAKKDEAREERHSCSVSFSHIDQLRPKTAIDSRGDWN